jgi:hypothetical protein
VNPKEAKASLPLGDDNEARIQVCNLLYPNSITYPAYKYLLKDHQGIHRINLLFQAIRKVLKKEGDTSRTAS